VTKLAVMFGVRREVLPSSNTVVRINPEGGSRAAPMLDELSGMRLL
jgi:hypothetical protein